MAHKVTIFAWVEAGQVHTESKFSGGKRVKNGKIEAFDHQNQIVHTGTTDEQGHHSFGVPAGARQLKIILTAGMGHTNHWIVRAAELGTDLKTENAPVTPPKPEMQPTPNTQAEPNATVGLDAQTIETIVEQVLDRKLTPIRSQLAQQQWGVRDILAGLGYILGLMGLASYIHFRKQLASLKKT
jgi:nickel transport protein